MRFEGLRRIVSCGCAYLAEHHVIIAKRPLDDVVVIACTNSAPQENFFPPTHLTVICPSQSAIMHLFTDIVVIEQSAGSRCRAMSRCQLEERKVKAAHVKKAR